MKKITIDEATVKQALEALEQPHPGVRTNFTDALKYREKIKQAITAIKEALAQPQQEPVAYWIPKAEQFCIADPSGRPFAKAWKPLYTSPPQRKPLTDERLSEIESKILIESGSYADVLRAVADEAAYGIKENT